MTKSQRQERGGGTGGGRGEIWGGAGGENSRTAGSLAPGPASLLCFIWKTCRQHLQIGNGSVHSDKIVPVISRPETALHGGPFN